LVNVELCDFEQINNFFDLILSLQLQKWLLREKVNFVLYLPGLGFHNNLLNVALVQGGKVALLKALHLRSSFFPTVDGLKSKVCF
jgi:hypothetical protein